MGSQNSLEISHPKSNTNHSLYLRTNPHVPQGIYGLDLNHPPKVHGRRRCRRKRDRFYYLTPNIGVPDSDENLKQTHS